MMRKIILVFLCCSLFAFGCSKGSPVLHDEQGNVIQSRQLMGKWVIINYWAAWCRHCIQEIPELNAFYHENQDKNVVFYGVNFDQLPVDALQRSIRQTQIEFPVLVEDPAALWGLSSVSVLPMTFIINPKGQVVKTMLGANTASYLQNTLEMLQNQ